MTHDPPLGTSFATLAAAPCPTHDEMLVAAEREFRAVDRRRVAEVLDELARPLFDLRSAVVRDRVATAATIAWEALPRDGTGPSSWLLGSALEERRAAAPIRAVLAVEVARRAGMRARPVRLRGSWFVTVHEHGTPVACELGADPVADVTAPCGCLCAHEVVLLVLGGLARAWRADGDVRRARRAAGLRLLLPLEPERRAAVLEESLRFGDQP